MTADALLVVVMSDEIDCHHITWMAMSVTAVVLTAIFAIPGRIVLEEIKSTSRIQRKKFQDSTPTEVTELEQSHHQLWVLLICNLVSTSLQLAVDAYLSLGVGGKTRECDSMFFDDNGGLFEQSLRLFSTVLDVPGLLMDDECDEAAYELLSGDERVVPSSSGRGRRFY
ncbi:hypothetical protein PRIC2_010731 [Phytophthora ramorum]